MQLAITFHGGMESITYEWGAFNHHKDGHDVSPDDTAQTQIATGLSSLSFSVRRCVLMWDTDCHGSVYFSLSLSVRIRVFV